MNEHEFNNISIKLEYFFNNRSLIKVFFYCFKYDNPSKIYRKSKMCYSNVLKQTQRLEKLGFIKTIKEGRKRNLYITDSGNEFFEKIEKFLKDL